MLPNKYVYSGLCHDAFHFSPILESRMFERQFERGPLEPSRLHTTTLMDPIEPHSTLRASECGLTGCGLVLPCGALWNVICFFSARKTSFHVSAGQFMRRLALGLLVTSTGMAETCHWLAAVLVGESFAPNPRTCSYFGSVDDHSCSSNSGTLLLMIWRSEVVPHSQTVSWGGVRRVISLSHFSSFRWVPVCVLCLL